MSDMEKKQDERSELPVTAMESEPLGPTKEPSPEFLAWLESLGTDGAERFYNGSQLMAEAGALVSKAGKAAEDGDAGQLEDFNRRVKVLAARADVTGFDWLSDLVRGFQIVITSMLYCVRGNQAVLVYRHHRAKQAYQDATTGIGKAIELLDRALDKFPQLHEFAEAKVSFQQAAYIYRHVQIFYVALEKNCDVDTLLLQGRVKEYLAGVRTLAGELRRMSDGMLSAGSDDPAMLALSAKCTAQADVIEDRAEAIEEMNGSRDIYLPPGGDKVFIVHGHAEDKWRELRDLLENELRLKGRVVVLKEEASQSKTVIEKFEEYANQCCYGFALVTPDDEVKKRDAAYRQARPNVMFEIGWFYGRFGPRRLCILKRAGTEIPSDLGGVVTLEFDNDIREKFLQIKQELEAAGIVTE